MTAGQQTLDSLLLPYQKRLVFARQKRKIALFGRQIGKSFSLAWLAVAKVLTAQKAGATALAISTGARASSEFLKKCAQWAEAVHVMRPDVTYTASADAVKFSTGARVVSLPSGNPAALRGWTASLVVIDEAAYIENPEDVWAAISPTITRDPDAELVLASTPAGKASWFYDLYCKALDDGAWYVQTTTIEDAVEEGLAVDVDGLKKTISDPDVWAREYLCRFDQEYSSMVDVGLLDFQEIDVRDDAPTWLGFDVGSTSDRSALVDLVQLPDKTYFVKDIVIMRKASYEHQLQVLKEKHQKARYQAGYIDANGIGSALAEYATKQVSAKIKGYTWTSGNKTPAYESLRALIFDRRLKFARHLKPLVVQDFSNVHRVVTESGKVSYQAGRNENGHSDATSALVLAIQAAVQHPRQAQLPSATRLNSMFGFSGGSAF